MSDTVVRVENLVKKYEISHQKQNVNISFRDAIANGTKSLGRKLKSSFSKQTFIPSREDFLALNNVSFEIKQGEVVGIIGRNGAGKSTLLKILSRITEPTGGRIRIRGRIASLLEVGTGFHHELTGRENIFLNGAILGMSKAEITKKFDEIVDFAEVEKFLDTPVKFYSSGMYVRLAFAVAAHLEPEILIVDEVLAVGDMQFQKKCLGKMDNVAKQGRTILFVSHNMSTVESLCNRGILLESGSVHLDSTAEEAVKAYLDKAYNLARDIPLSQRKDRSGNGKLRVLSFRILNEQGQEEPAMQSGKNYYFEFGYINNTGSCLKNVVISFDLVDERGARILLLKNSFTNHTLNLDGDRGYIFCGIENLPVVQGLYRMTIHLAQADVELLDRVEDAVTVSVDGGDFFGTGSPGLPHLCKFLVKNDWYTESSRVMSNE